ncbi:hypothetical protein [uncultured Enterococcus sp.]|uniref:hypothetical protein n=1 Tax=uncultured Enterococcus sp. TaxID=167972 RepID=UPI002AA806C6|nr:hypothetical protein [uncultured Enterococcus sp.]
MEKFQKRGYVVRETGPVYYTKNMDQTIQWFETVLGWYSEVDERNSSGDGLYGCVYDTPPVFENLHLAPFTGIHLFYGEPKQGMIAFLKVFGIEQLHSFVKKAGWSGISPVKIELWGGKTCSIQTIDDCELRFFEVES